MPSDLLKAEIAKLLSLRPLGVGNSRFNMYDSLMHFLYHWSCHMGDSGSWL